MSDAANYAALNALLINLGRSLLQYVGECWPWTSMEAGEVQEKITGLVKRQEKQVAELTQLLHQAEWAIDFGTYPTEYTDLHYVALSYLLDQIVHNQLAIAEDAKQMLPACEGHPEAQKLVGEIQAAQQAIAREVEVLQPLANGQAKTV